MNSTLPLGGAHLRTYNQIFQHPISRNLDWREVWALLDEIGEIAKEPHGNLKVTRNGLSLVLHPSRMKDVSSDAEVMALRRFLVQSADAPHPANEQQAHWLLVIDHHKARIFRTELSGSIPVQIFPHEPHEYFRRDSDNFFQPVAGALQSGGKILIFGSATGTSSEMEQFVAWVKIHHAELGRRIIGTLVVDEQHLTPVELLVKARGFYANHQRVLA